MKKKVSFFKNIVLIFILSTLVNISAKAQSEVVNTSSKNNVYFDTGIFPGAHIFMNYERKVHESDKISLYGRVGFGYAGMILGDAGGGVLGAATLLTGKRNSHMEFNLGIFSGKDNNDPFILPLLDVGYRYQKPEGGLIFKVKAGILGIFSVGLGYAF
tara:strand:- start:89 stop:562 length:474 start_codon:yes stop_codon:yes gene_type:complete